MCRPGPGHLGPPHLAAGSSPSPRPRPQLRTQARREGAAVAPSTASPEPQTPGPHAQTRTAPPGMPWEAGPACADARGLGGKCFPNEIKRGLFPLQP